MANILHNTSNTGITMYTILYIYKTKYTHTRNVYTLYTLTHTHTHSNTKTITTRKCVCMCVFFKEKLSIDKKIAYIQNNDNLPSELSIA